MRSSRIPWPGDESEERWNLAWKAIKKVSSPQLLYVDYVMCQLYMFHILIKFQKCVLWFGASKLGEKGFVASLF